MAGVATAQAGAPGTETGDKTDTAPRVEVAPDRSWVSVSGTIVSSRPDSFRLVYGSGVMTVEMDDFDAYAEGRPLMENDKVIVYGTIDDDLFEKRTIEARSVYVESLQTHFYASAADEEGPIAMPLGGPIVTGRMEVTGTVTSVDGRTFALRSGSSTVQVDTIGLSYNPMDTDGYQRIEVGDLVRVAGEFTDGFFLKTMLAADWIVELRD